MDDESSLDDGRRTEDNNRMMTQFHHALQQMREQSLADSQRLFEYVLDALPRNKRRRASARIHQYEHGDTASVTKKRKLEQTIAEAAPIMAYLQSLKTLVCT
jgi:hypothetical protein